MKSRQISLHTVSSEPEFCVEYKNVVSIIYLISLVALLWLGQFVCRDAFLQSTKAVSGICNLL